MNKSVTIAEEVKKMFDIWGSYASPYCNGQYESETMAAVKGFVAIGRFLESTHWTIRARIMAAIIVKNDGITYTELGAAHSSSGQLSENWVIEHIEILDAFQKAIQVRNRTENQRRASDMFEELRK
jgi:hypothetical protein